jgi:general secretion pathway protein C
MLARWWTFVVWALVAAGALFWGLRLLVSAPPVPPGTPVATLGPAVRGDLTRLLGADPPPVVAATAAAPPPDARFQLIGVVTPRERSASREGLALIAVDGKPAKAFRVGAVIDGQTILKSVAARGAMLGPRDGAPQVSLSLAPPSAAATGALPTLAARPAEAPDVAAPPVVGGDRARARALRGKLSPPPAMPSGEAGPRAQPGMPTN